MCVSLLEATFRFIRSYHLNHDLEVVKRYVELGLGISIVPMINVQHEVRSGRLVARSLPWIPRNVVGVVQRKSAYLSPAANEFVRRLVDHTAPE